MSNCLNCQSKSSDEGSQEDPDASISDNDLIGNGDAPHEQKMSLTTRTRMLQLQTALSSSAALDDSLSNSLEPAILRHLATINGLLTNSEPAAAVTNYTMEFSKYCRNNGNLLTLSTYAAVSRT